MSKIKGLILSLLFIVPVWGAVSFDGVDDYIEIADSASISVTGEITVSAWFKGPTSNPNVTNNGIIAKYQSQTGSLNKRSYVLYVTVTNCYLGGVISSDGTFTNTSGVEATTDICDGTWHHVGMIFIPGTEVTIFVDGQQVASDTTAVETSIYDGDNALWIGTQFDTTNTHTYLDGDVDDVRIYDRALTDAEMDAIYNIGMRRIGGPLGWASNVTATDAQGNYNGTITWAAPSEGKDSQGSLRFNGNDYVDLGDITEIDDVTELSFMAWIKTTDTGTDQRIIYSPRDTGGLTRVSLGQNNANVEGQFRDSGGTYRTFNGSDVINDGAWHHVALVAGSSEVQLFVDGVEDTSLGFTLTTATTTETDHIGGRGGNGDYFTGQIDDARIYSIALSTQDIADVHSGVGISTVPVAQYLFEGEGRGLVAHYELDDKGINTYAGQAFEVYGPYVGEFFGFDNNNITFSTDVPSAVGVGTSLDFNGSDEYINVAHNTALNPGSGDWSISLWAKPAAVNQSATFIAKRNTSSPFNQWSVGVADNYRTGTTGQKVGFLYIENAGNPERSYRTTNDVVTGDWMHIVVTLDPTTDTEKIYVNNVDQALTALTAAGAWPNVSNSNPVTIGWNQGSGYFNGPLDDIRLYNVVLSSDDVDDLYTGVGLSTAPVARWNLDDSAIKDISGKGNHGKGKGGSSLIHDGGKTRR